jgi:hypothetical protein
MIGYFSPKREVSRFLVHEAEFTWFAITAPLRRSAETQLRFINLLTSNVSSNLGRRAQEQAVILTFDCSMI